MQSGMLKGLWLGARLPLGNHDNWGPDPLQEGCHDNRRDQHKGCHEPQPPTQYRQVVIIHAAAPDRCTWRQA